MYYYYYYYYYLSTIVFHLHTGITATWQISWHKLSQKVVYLQQSSPPVCRSDMWENLSWRWSGPTKTLSQKEMRWVSWFSKVERGGRRSGMGSRRGKEERQWTPWFHYNYRKCSLSFYHSVLVLQHSTTNDELWFPNLGQVLPKDKKKQGREKKCEHRLFMSITMMYVCVFVLIAAH